MSEVDFMGPERTPARRRDEDGAPAERDPLQALQSSMGNTAVARMLQRTADTGDEDEAVNRAHDPALAQRQGESPDEEVEDEDSVSRAADPTLAMRAAAPEVGMAGGGLSDALAGRIDAQRGGGAGLDAGTRNTMEDTLGASLDGVRVHVGQESDHLNSSISAKAFTTGNDVFVRSDQWAPGSSSTQRLLAHELTHVVQQRTMAGEGGSMSVGASDTSEEREADDVAEHVMQRTADGEQDVDEA